MALLPFAWKSGSSSASMAIGSAITGGTLGSVLFIGPGGLAQDNAGAFYDATNHRLWLWAAGAGSGWPVAASKLNIYSASDAPLTLVGDGVSSDVSVYAYGTVTPGLFARHA